MQLPSSGWLVALVATMATAACQTGATRPGGDPPGHPKPGAPVEVRLDARPVGGGAYEVTLSATPTRAVKVLELSLDGKDTSAGPTAAGQRRTLTTRISLGDAGFRDVTGSAMVDVGQHRRRAAADLHLGAAAAAPVAPRVNVVRLPDGSEAAEVRP